MRGGGVGGNDRSGSSGSGSDVIVMSLLCTRLLRQRSFLSDSFES